jgi:preprotein translocase subunit SecB
MSEQETVEQQVADENEGSMESAQIGFFVGRHYLCDLSVENPTGRVEDTQLQEIVYALDGSVNAKQLGEEGLFLVELGLRLTAILRDRVVFMVEITYRVEVELRGIPEPVQPFTLGVSVPEWIFPLLQEILQRNAAYAGYPEAIFNAPDYRGKYVANQESRAV